MAGLQTILLAFRRISFAPQRWPNARLSWKRHTSSQPNAKHGSRKRTLRVVSTLTPEKMGRAGQEIIDFSNIAGIWLTTRNGKVRLRFAYGATPFPPRTTGVPYLRHIPGNYLKSELRIRLCDRVEHFARGSDLLAKEEEPWNIAVHHMKQAKLTYQPLLDIIEEEFGDIPDVESNRDVKTLLPDEMASTGQAVFDVSGRKAFKCLLHPGKPRSIFVYHKSHPFPPNTRGVFYSALDNTELRFRLCSKVEDFHAGLDLLLPNGKPWSRRRIQRVLVLNPPMESTTKQKTSRQKSAGDKNWISTLVPRNITSSGQKVINTHSTTSIVVWVFNRYASSKLVLHRVQIQGFTPEKVYKGVFYYRHVLGDDEQSQLRFRLCSTTAEFANGEDAIGKTGRTWNWPLRRMKRGPNTYQPILNLIREEYGLLDSDTNARPSTEGSESTSSRPSRSIVTQTTSQKVSGTKNIISTLVPENMIPSGQEIVKIHSTSSVLVRVFNRNSAGEGVIHKVQLDGFSLKQTYSGVFYYHHVQGDDKKSQLRFRLCSTTADFAEGEDAIGRGGNIWNRPLLNLRMSLRYQQIFNMIREEHGLLETDTDALPVTHEASSPYPPIVAKTTSQKASGIKNRILTLVPQNIISSGQKVINTRPTSSIVVVVFNRGASGEPILHRVQIRGFSPEKLSNGIFYYHHVPGDEEQSQLRFRLCSTTAEFGKGKDAIVKSGKIWNRPLSDLRRFSRYQSILNLIREEYGLLDSCADALPSIDGPGSEPGHPSSPTNAQTASQKAFDTKNLISTLLPKNIIPSGQEIVNICSSSNDFMRILNRNASGERVTRGVWMYGFSIDKAYSGVFYFHHVPGDNEQAQLRFRLCPTTADFGQGEDATVERGKIWNRPLSNLRRYSRYHLILNMVREEYGLLKSSKGVLKSNHPLLPIASLSPQKLIPLKQQILDISGLHDVFLNAAPTVRGRRKKRIQVEDPTSDSAAFPPDTVGVFYYKQSLTSPTQIGELRFRLCHDLAFFDHSEDLTFPTGDPWYIDLQQLYLNERYRALRNILFREGLVEQNPRLEDHVNPQLRSQEDALVMSSLSQPFSLELSREQQTFWVQTDSKKWVMLKIKGLFSPQKQSNNAYNGRVVARFEPYPQNVDSPSNTQQQRPLLALRFLEVLAPIRRISDDDFMKRPVPGQLHMICSPSVNGTPREYCPWGFRNSDLKNRQILLGLVKDTEVKKS